MSGNNSTQKSLYSDMPLNFSRNRSEPRSVRGKNINHGNFLPYMDTPNGPKINKFVNRVICNEKNVKSFKDHLTRNRAHSTENS